MTTFSRLDRPLTCSTMFRMHPPSIRGHERQALETVAKKALNREGADELSAARVSLTGTGYVEEIEDGAGGLLLQTQYTLGSEELMVLLALMALAGMGLHHGDRYKAVRGRAKVKLPARTINVRRAANGDVEGELSLNCLVTEIGQSCTTKNRLRAVVGLVRLAGVTCLDLGRAGRPSKLRTGPRLLDFSYTPNPATGKRELTFKLSSRLTLAVLQKTAREGDAVRVEMDEARQLSDGARILHAHLTAAVPCNRDGAVIALSDMARWIYGPDPSAACRTRAKIAAAAIQTLDHWVVEDAVRPARGQAAAEPRLDAVRVRRLTEAEVEEAGRKAIRAAAEGKPAGRQPLPKALQIRPRSDSDTMKRLKAVGQRLPSNASASSATGAVENPSNVISPRQRRAPSPALP